MKLKRIVAGITACTIVGSTMLTMPVSARTTTKAENVSLSDLLNTAKMVADLKDDMTTEKQAEILDRFDTDGSGNISIAELLEVAKRVARIDESDIVNEYGTADSEETTVTTEEVTFDPTLTIGGTEYKDGDTFIATANEIYEIEVSDGENELTISLTGSKDDEDNDLVRVDGNRFETIKDGTLTITVKTDDGQEKTITINVKIKNSLEDADLSDIFLKYSFADSNYYSDDYKKFSNEVGKDIFNNDTEIEDSEQYWEDKDKKCWSTNIDDGLISIGIGARVEIKGFKTGANEDYDVDDKITYISTDTNKVTVDENGVITGIAEGDTDIIVMANGKQVSKFTVSVSDATYSIIEPSDEKYAFNYAYSAYVSSSIGAGMDSHYEYKCLTQGKYVENASKGEALSLKDLQNQVGAENIKSVSVKKFDGTKRELTSIDYVDGVMYYMDTTTSTVYYAITSETGQGEFRLIFDNNDKVKVKVLDMEQYKNYQATLPEALIFEFQGCKVAATAENNCIYTIGYLTEGETFSLSDIVRVNGVDDPKITVTNSQDGTTAQNLDYDPLTKTFTARELTEENSGFNNLEIITFTYKATDGTTRTIKFTVSVCKPIVAFNPAELGYDADPNIFGTKDDFTSNYADMNGGKIYIQKDMNQYDLMELVKKSVALSALINEDGVYQQRLKLSSGYISTVVNVNMWGKFIIDNEKMFRVNEINAHMNTIEWADGYKLTTGDTATITATEMAGNPNLKLSFTIEIVDELPKAVKTGIGTDKFEYPKDNKANQYITFDNIVDVNNLPEDCTLVPYVESASENVGYIDEKGEKQQTSSSTMTVDTTGIKVIKGSNGHYSISGIEVASASRVDFGTFMNVKVKVLDGKGNTITISDPIKLSVKGEQGMGMTINGESKTIKAGETADFGTIYIKEGESINFSASGISADALSVSEIDSATVDKNKGTITAKELTSAISEGNTDGKEITFTYGTGSGVITAKVKIVVVKTKIMAYYAPYGRTVEVEDGGTFWSADGNTLTAYFVTAVDAEGIPTKYYQTINYETDANGNAVFKCPENLETTVSCPVKKAEITAGDYGDSMQVDKNVKEVTFPVAVSTGLSFESGEPQYDKSIITVGNKVDSNNAVVFSGIDASNVHKNSGNANSISISFVINAKDQNGIVVAQKTASLSFTENLFILTINGKSAETDSSTPKAIADTIYVQEGKEINYETGCFQNGGETDTNATITATSDNTSLVTVGDGKIKADTLTGATNNNTTVTFNYIADNGQERTITANVVVVKPVAVAPAYIGNGYINVTDDVYCTADINSKKAIPAFATKVDANGKPILDESLITGDMFTSVKDIFVTGDESGKIVDWECQGITITVKNRNIDPSGAENFFKANTNIRCINADRNDTTLSFPNPWEKCSNLPDDWSIGVVNADSNSEWTPKFTNVSTVECTRADNTDLGDITTLNLTAELRDKNGNLVKQDTQTLNAYIRPKMTVEQIFNYENKEFTYKVNLDVSGWEVTGAKLDAGNNSNIGNIEFNNNTKEITVKYKTAIDNATKATVRVEVTNKDGGGTNTGVGFTATPVEVTTTLLDATYSSDTSMVRYGYTSSETFNKVSVPANAGYTAQINDETILVTGKLTDNVELTLKNDNVQITKTLPTAVPGITASNFSQSENIENKTFKYNVTIPSGWALESAVSKDESKYKASYDGNGELTVETVGDTTDNEVALALTFKNGGLTWQKDVTLTVLKVNSFPQIKLSKKTATTSDNKEFFYEISNSEELKYWDIRKVEEPQKYDIDFASESAFRLLFTPAITETQNMTIKYKLQKRDGFITYISPEYTLEVTATYTPSQDITDTGSED